MSTIAVRFLFTLMCAFCLFLPIVSESADLPKDPILQLDTGMHNAPIQAIAVDMGGRFLVTGAADKQVRIWSLSDGQLLRSIRVPIDGNTQGNILAVAISPDGETIACGGHTYSEANRNYHIYIFDRSSGRMLKRISGVPARIRALKYSPDGKVLAAGLVKGGVALFNSGNFAATVSAQSFDGSVRSLDFDGAGRLLVSSSDGRIVLFDSALQTIAETKTKSGKSAGVAFSPDGERIAAKVTDDAQIDILSGRDLRHQYSAEPSGHSGKGLSSVAWSRDGRTLFAGGRFKKDGAYPVVMWDNSGRGAAKLLAGGRDTVMALVAAGSNSIAYATADPAIGAYAADGSLIFHKRDMKTDYRGSSIRLSPDGSAIAPVFDGKNIGYRFSFEIGMFDRSLGRDAEMAEPVRASAKLNLTDWRNHKEPKLNGKRLPIAEGEESRSVALAPGMRNFLLGGDWYLYQFDAAGTVVWKRRIATIAWTLNISADGKLAVAGHGDGTVRWYRMKDGTEVAALYRATKHDGKGVSWVSWTPQGFYTASPKGEALLGWHVNNGFEREAFFYSIGRFRDKYYRPDVLAAVAKNIDAASVPSVGASPSIGRSLPPVVQITAPADGAQIATDKVPVRFTVESPAGEEITSVKVLLDGRPVSQARDIVLDQPAVSSSATGSAGKNVSSRKVEVPLQNAAGTITVIAMSKSGASEPVSVTVNRKTAPAVNKSDAYAIKPKLYVLSVGVSKYSRHPEFNLMFAGKDAKDFASAMNSQKGKLYRDVSSKVLTDGQATREAIIDGLQWLKRSATQHDVAMIFMSSHGDNSSGQYYFIPADVDKKRLESTSVLFTYIKDAVASIPGKVLVFMDTCHAGDVLGRRGSKAIPPDINGIVNELTSAENGAIVFTSSTGRQQSLEDEKWNNGAFTRALIDGLAGRADLTGKGRITVNMLDVYLSERVKELTEGRQTPTTAKPQTIQDFPIAVVR